MGLAEYLEDQSGVISNEKEAMLKQFSGYFDEITYDTVNQLFVVEKDGKFNFIDEADVTFSPVYYDYYQLYPGFAVVRKGNQVGNLFFHEGLSEPAAYRTVAIFEIKWNEHYGIKTDKGDTLLDRTYSFVKIYPQFIVARSWEGYSLFHLDGRRMFDDFFDEIDLSMMYHGFIFVHNNSEWGVVDVTGYWIVPALFHTKNDIEWWGQGYFYCRTGNNKKGLYTTQGQLIVPFEYDSIQMGTDWRPSPFIVTQNGKYGLTDRESKVIFPCIYDKIKSLGNSYRMWKEGKDTLWEMSRIYDWPGRRPAQEGESSCLQAESSCCDFFKMIGSLLEIGEEYSREEEYDGTQRMEEVNEKEAIRWFLMSLVFDENNRYNFDSMVRYLTKKLRHASVRKNEKLISLLELYAVVKRNYEERKIYKITTRY